MKPFRLLITSLLLLPGLLVLTAFDETHQAQQTTSPTPTYDPLLEPPLPPNPTELELGRNLYWHWCMPCHGDRAQGLTDEFRMIWEPDHQNCWDRGCHAGLPRDEGFPIPTVVPALAGEGKLGGFASLQELSDFLSATHPPQSPGILKPEQYHAIAAYVFELNGRTVDTILLLPTPTAPPIAEATPKGSYAEYVLLGLILPLAILFAVILTRKENRAE